MPPINAPQNVLLAAAFAGLSISATTAEAATVLTETTDFSNDSGNPTDLTTTFTNFLSDSGIIGSINNSGDFSDYFTVAMTPNAAATIPVFFSTSAFYFVDVFNSSQESARWSERVQFRPVRS